MGIRKKIGVQQGFSKAVPSKIADPMEGQSDSLIQYLPD